MTRRPRWNRIAIAAFLLVLVIVLPHLISVLNSMDLPDTVEAICPDSCDTDEIRGMLMLCVVLLFIVLLAKELMTD